METVLVTGGAGFIGSHLCEALLRQGTAVVTIDNLHPYYDPKRKEKNLQALREYPNFRFYKVDLRDFGALRGVFSKHSFYSVAHLGGNGGVRASLEDPKYYEETIVGGTLNMLRLAQKYRTRVFVFGSSSSVYGSRTKVPFREDEPTASPQSPYAAAKRSAELFCYAWHRLYKMDITCLRFFTVYGPRGRPDMAPYKFVKWVDSGQPIVKFGDGSSKRDYTYVADIVAGIVAALNKPLGFEIINLGNNHPVSLNDFIALVERVVGKPARVIEKPMPKADVPITYADISKAKKLLGYKPKTKLEEGMQKFYEWYKANK